MVYKFLRVPPSNGLKLQPIRHHPALLDGFLACCPFGIQLNAHQWKFPNWSAKARLIYSKLQLFNDYFLGVFVGQVLLASDTLRIPLKIQFWLKRREIQSVDIQKKELPYAGLIIELYIKPVPVEYCLNWTVLFTAFNFHSKGSHSGIYLLNWHCCHVHGCFVMYAS